MKPNARELGFLNEHFDGEELKNAIERFDSGEPLAYIIGEWYFYGLTFKLNKSCLIPRADTEHVAEKAINILPKNGHFADLCTGSGCIAVSVSANRSDCTGYACDISGEAIEKARENAVLNGASEQIGFEVADIFELTLPESEFDLIISNPPYIKTNVIPTLDTVTHEPKTALDGGADGMRFYTHIVENFAAALKPNGAFLFEIGYDQRADITALAEKNGFSCEITKDYGGNDRVAYIKKKI